jgi:hypothetical protein
MSKKVRHAKLKNTGVLFEVLTRQVTADIISNRNSNAINVIKEFFNKDKELGKELELYNILTNETYNTTEKSTKLVEAVVKSRQKLANSVLRREKYNLIKEIKNNYDVNELFATRIPNYKRLASIYKLFEHEATEKTLAPNEYVDVHSFLVECISSSKVVKKETTTGVAAEDKDVRLLAYSLMIEKFNKKYSILNERQKRVLKNYINNVSNTNNLHEYVSTEVNKIKKELTTMLPDIDDKVTKIKLSEVIKQADTIVSKQTISEENLTKLMRYYELIQEIKNVHKRKSTKTINS